jgi:hypothetical protein
MAHFVTIAHVGGACDYLRVQIADMKMKSEILAYVRNNVRSIETALLHCSRPRRN